jgi:hypothetical protein
LYGNGTLQTFDTGGLWDPTVANGVYLTLERLGDTVRNSVNGTYQGTGTALTAGYTFNSVFGSTDPPTIGNATTTALTSPFVLLLAQYRITMGAARYGHTNFTPPTGPYPT